MIEITLVCDTCSCKLPFNKPCSSPDIEKRPHFMDASGIRVSVEFKSYGWEIFRNKLYCATCKHREIVSL